MIEATVNRLSACLTREMSRVEGVALNRELFLVRCKEAILFFAQMKTLEVDLEIVAHDLTQSCFITARGSSVETHFEIFAKHVNELGEEEILCTQYMGDECLGTMWDTCANGLLRLTYFYTVNKIG